MRKAEETVRRVEGWLLLAVGAIVAIAYLLSKI